MKKFGRYISFFAYRAKFWKLSGKFLQTAQKNLKYSSYFLSSVKNFGWYLLIILHTANRNGTWHSSMDVRFHTNGSQKPFTRSQPTILKVRIRYNRVQHSILDVRLRQNRIHHSILEVGLRLNGSEYLILRVSLQQIESPHPLWESRFNRMYVSIWLLNVDFHFGRAIASN